jgi:replicative superfamily II helicase
MAFKPRNKSFAATDSPNSLFRDIRNRKVQGLLDHQAYMLQEYTEHAFNKPHVALELPTGSGKTLVGLLIAEYRRRVNGEKVVYLCPTKQLVNQVVEQSKMKYGIRTHAFIGPQRDYDPVAKSEYMRSSTIAVSTFSALFNTNPYFEDPDLIVLDDAQWY